MFLDLPPTRQGPQMAKKIAFALGTVFSFTKSHAWLGTSNGFSQMAYIVRVRVAV